MTPQEIPSLPSVPPGGPSYPFGPDRNVDGECLVATDETDAKALGRWQVFGLAGQ